MAEADRPDTVMDDEGPGFDTVIDDEGPDDEGPGFQVDEKPEDFLLVVVVDTDFDSSSPDNKRFPVPHDHKLNIAWTKRERKLAEAGEFVEDMDDLQDKVSH